MIRDHNKYCRQDESLWHSVFEALHRVDTISMSTRWEAFAMLADYRVSVARRLPHTEGPAGHNMRANIHCASTIDHRTILQRVCLTR